MKIGHVLLGLLIAVMALVNTFRDVSYGEIIHSVLTLRYHYLSLAVVLFVLGFFIRACRWHYFCCSLKNIPTSRLYSPMMVGFMGNLLPLRAGEFIRAFLMGKREGISFSSSFATVVVERIFDFFSLLVLFAALLVIEPEVFVSNGTEQEQSQVAGYLRSFGTTSLLVGVGLVVFCYLLVRQQDRILTLLRIGTRVLPHRMQNRIEAMLRSFVLGLGVLKDPKGIVITVILSAFLWGTILLNNYPIYYCYDIHTELPFSSLLTVLVVTCALIIVLPTPGYLGPFQLGTTYVLANLYGVDKSVAASFSLVTWFLQQGLTCIAGLFFIVKDNISFLELSRDARREAQEVSRHATHDGMLK